MTLVRALAERAHEISGATLTVSVPQFDLGPFIETGWSVEIENFIGPLGRPYENEGLAPYSPLPFSLTFKANDERPDEAKPLDVVLAVAAPPNQPGTDLLRPPVLVQARTRPACTEGRRSRSIPRSSAPLATCSCPLMKSTRWWRSSRRGRAVKPFSKSPPHSLRIDAPPSRR